VKNLEQYFFEEVESLNPIFFKKIAKTFFKRKGKADIFSMGFYSSGGHSTSTLRRVGLERQRCSGAGLVRWTAHAGK
jgi:hypothetical protein